MVPPAQCDIWLARPVRHKDVADETVRRLLRLRITTPTPLTHALTLVFYAEPGIE